MSASASVFARRTVKVNWRSTLSITCQQHAGGSGNWENVTDIATAR